MSKLGTETASSYVQLTGRVDVASTPTQCTVKRPEATLNPKNIYGKVNYYPDEYDI